MKPTHSIGKGIGNGEYSCSYFVGTIHLHICNIISYVYYITIMCKIELYICQNYKKVNIVKLYMEHGNPAHKSFREISSSY